MGVFQDSEDLRPFSFQLTKSSDQRK